MIRNPRVWLYAAGGWLILVGLAHSVTHVWTFVLENGLVGQREFAMRAMKQAYSFDPFQTSMWTLFRSFSMSTALLPLFAGSTAVLLAWTGSPARTLRSYAMFGTVFWTGAFILFAFIDPVIPPILVAALAVPLHGLAWLTADQVVKEEG